MWVSSSKLPFRKEQHKAYHEEVKKNGISKNEILSLNSFKMEVFSYRDTLKFDLNGDSQYFSQYMWHVFLEDFVLIALLSIEPHDLDLISGQLTHIVTTLDC